MSQENVNRSASQFGFDDVLRYLKGLVGHHAEVSANAVRGGQASLFVVGTVSAVRSYPSGVHFCQVGERRENGFFLSPHSFDWGSLDLADPDSFMLRIHHKETDYEIWICDDRLSGYERLPGLDEPE